jgi:hypothetical protein
MFHAFRVIVDEFPEGEEGVLALTDALGDAGCLDASIGGHPDGVEVDFDREAESLDAAIKSAVAAIEEAGFRVLRVELERESIVLEG